MASQPDEYAYEAAIMQADVNRNLANEPAFRTRIIDKLNAQSAQSRKNMVLRLPQPSPVGHCTMISHTWTTDEAENYLAASADNRVLPRDLSTADEDGNIIVLWIFNAVGTDGKLPELELDPMPDFERYPALCMFDIDGAGNTALIPSGDLEMRSTSPGKVQFVLNKNRGSAA